MGLWKHCLGTFGGEVEERKSASSWTLSSERRIRVEYRPIAELKLDPLNPRVHSRRQTRQIARSVKSFGFNVPVLIDSNGNVIAGHGRILACQLLGLDEVPTIRLHHLSEAQARAYLIADNRLTEISDWDDRLLAEQLQALSVLNLDFDLEATGFETGEIDLRIEGLAADIDDTADQIPTEPIGPSVTRPGDLWLLDQHRVYCGSALEKAAYIAVMDRQKAATVITDPPSTSQFLETSAAWENTNMATSKWLQAK